MTAPKVPLSTRTRRVVLTDVFDAVPILRRLPEAQRILHEYEAAGYPSGTGATSLGGATHCDPTGQAAVAAATAGRRPDEMIGVSEQIDRLLLEIRDRVQELATRITWATETTEVPGADGCWFCARVQHGNSWQETYTRIPREPANASSLAVAVCSWHYDFRRRWAVNPAPQLVVAHLDGQRITSRMVRDFHPEAYMEAGAREAVRA